MKPKYTKVLLLLSCVGFLLSCNLFNAVSERKKKRDEEQRNLLLLLFPEAAESNHALYRYVPDGTTNLPTVEQFTEIAVASKTSKTKIVLIHGWDASERSTDAVTGKTKKVENINATWQYAFQFYNIDVASAQTNYDLYAFTYRTSETVASNGERFVESLNSAFEATDKVVVLAHSMGGLVTRAAMYSSSNTNDIIDIVVTLGTPYYGSPFASSEYQAGLGVLGDLASFLTATNGGQDLAHTNNGTGQTSISGATNTYLDTLNANTDRDNRFYPYVGVLSSCDSAKSGEIYSTGCSTLKNNSPAFNQSDGIVPYNSAIMADKSVNFDLATMAEFNFDHKMLAFNIPSDEVTASAFFTEVMQKIDTISQ
ncbi:MAG: alpha/beta hydrolase [Spirochaetota bacterium]